MNNKQSKTELIRLVRAGMDEICTSEKLNLSIKDLIVTGSPPNRFEVFLVVRFLASAAPFCCGEPGCYSKLFWNEGEQELGEFLKRKMNLKHDVEICIKSQVEYAPGIKFTALH